MPCEGQKPDYLCAGWQARATRIRIRDRDRCMGCDRSEDDGIVLHVHHRAYGKSGPCGACVLTGVDDTDLITLCRECHKAITSIRRAWRYGKRVHQVDDEPIPFATKLPSYPKIVLNADPIAPPEPAKAIGNREPFDPFKQEE